MDVGWGAGGEPSRHAQDDLGLGFEDGWGRGGRVAVTERPAHPDSLRNQLMLGVGTAARLHERLMVQPGCALLTTWEELS